VTGVAPDVGAKLSHAQSEPSEEVYVSPLAGFVLLSEMVCAAGTVPPIVKVPKDSVGGAADKVGIGAAETVKLAVTVGLGDTPAALNVMTHE
jgi:hypothetical protein